MRKMKIVIAAAAFLTMPCSQALAGPRVVVGVGVGVGVPYYRPYYAHPYYYPAPYPYYYAPPAVYAPPPVVYVQPGPVYVQPQPGQALPQQGVPGYQQAPQYAYPPNSSAAPAAYYSAQPQPASASGQLQQPYNMGPPAGPPQPVVPQRLSSPTPNP